MKAMTALVWREFLEHKGAFFIAPATLLAGLFILILVTMIFGHGDVTDIDGVLLSGAQIYRIALAGGMAMWMAYLLVALFFYYADSFSADRRNNSLLFWKSMPQSDLRVLTAKALAGITLFPALIFAFYMIMGVLTYVLGFVLAFRLPIPLIGPIDMVSSLLMMGLTAAVGMILTIVWYAPFLAWVAGLSTLVQRWSIPLAFLIPGVLVIVESTTQFGQAGGARPIADYLKFRSSWGMDDSAVGDKILHGGTMVPLELIGDMLAHYDWLQAVLGLAVAAVLVYLASEYRRRRIEA